MLIAVLVDATIVRALLVPATMRVLADANYDGLRGRDDSPPHV